MMINTHLPKHPEVRIFDKTDAGVHKAEIRCHICKTFVAVDIK